VKRSERRATDLGGRDHLVPVPRVVGVERHLLDEAQLVAARDGPLEEIRRLVVVDAAHEHRVDLDGREPRCRGGVDAVEHAVEERPARDEPERLGVHGVERDVDPVEPRVLERLRARGQADRVGRERDLGPVGERRAGRDDLDEVASQQRLTAREAHLPHAEVARPDAHEPLDLGELQRLPVGREGEALGRHAVGAAQVAAVGERDAEVGRAAAEGVEERRIVGPGGARSGGGTRHRRHPQRGAHASRLRARRGGADVARIIAARARRACGP
jgi:hypothetical protein